MNVFCRADAAEAVKAARAELAQATQAAQAEIERAKADAEAARAEVKRAVEGGRAAASAWQERLRRTHARYDEERTKERQGFEATREHLDAELEDRVNAALHANRQLSICWRSWAGTADKRKAAMKALRRGAAI